MGIMNIKPNRLKAGDKIRVIAPSALFDKADFKKGVKRLEGLGLNVVFRKDIFLKHGYLAGSDQRRSNELLEAFEDKSCKAIFCARGGFGAARLFDKIDFKLVEDNPKIFVGFSDITALHLAFLSLSKLITFSGPVIASKNFIDISMQNLNGLKKALFTADPLKYKFPKGTIVLAEGFAQGPIIGGNLSIIHSMAATRFIPDFNGKILFFEDVGEAPYKIDRMLCHLSQLKIFSGIKGLIAGQFINDKRSAKKTDEKFIKKIILEYFGDFKIPIVFNFPIGHGVENVVIPVGADAGFNTKSRELISEAGVL